MEIEKVSEVCVKPSSPTPSHRKTYKISLLDQCMPPVYIPMVIYYSNKETTSSDDSISKRSLILKESLSETLSLFYPFAGKIKDDHSIDCNDEGVCYVEAKADISLSEYLRQPLTYVVKLFPGKEIGELQPLRSYVVKIQETTFSCGGFAIALLVSHVISDGICLSSFLKDWAAITSCQSNINITSPYLESPSIFLQSNSFSKEEASLTGPFFKKMKLVSKRFVFKAPEIMNLKDKIINSGVESPTRVEVVTALLCKCLMAAFKARSRKDKPLAITHSVNLRRRAAPKIPECSLGNFVAGAATLCPPENAELGLLVRHVREAIGKIDGDFVKKLQGDGGYERLCEIIKETREVFGSPEVVFSGGVDYVGFTSWCNFGLYDIDFGWGKPVWTSCRGTSSIIEMVFMNLITLMDTRKEKGIEAWVYLDEDDMILLEKDEELLQYASVDPIP